MGSFKHHKFKKMYKFIFPLVLGLCHGDKSGHVQQHAAPAQVAAPSSAPGVSPYYAQYDYEAYEPQPQSFTSGGLDRQASIEAVLGAPVVITAFAAALFGGILSPLISEGLSRMSEYQIEWPSFSQRVERKKSKTRNKTSKAREFDDVDTSMSWLEVLDNVHNVISVVSNLSKRSVETDKPAE